MSGLLSKLRLKHFALPLFSLIIIGTMLYWLGIDKIVELAKVITTVKPGFFPLLLGLGLVELLLMAARITYYMKVLEPQASSWKVMAMYVMGYPFVFGLPVRVVGLFVRAYAIKKKTNTWIGSSITSTLVEKGVNGATSIALALIGLIALFGLVSGDLSQSFYSLGTGLIALLAVIAFLLKTGKVEKLAVKILERTARLFRKDEGLAKKYVECFRKITRPKQIFVAMLLTVGMWAANFTRVYLIFLMLGQDIGLFLIAGAVSVAYIVGVVSQTPGGLGAFELGFTSVMVLKGFESSTVVSAVLVERLFSYWLFMALGLILVLFNRKLMEAVWDKTIGKLLEGKPVKKIKETALKVKENHDKKKIVRKTIKAERKAWKAKK